MRRAEGRGGAQDNMKAWYVRRRVANPSARARPPVTVCICADHIPQSSGAQKHDSHAATLWL